MKTVYLAMALLVGGTMVSQGVAAPARSQAVALAAADSKASIDALALALYEAVLENPSEAVSICEEVLAQRDSWTPAECEVLLRAVLLASPEMKVGLSQAVKSTQSSSSSQGEASTESAEATESTEATEGAATESSAATTTTATENTVSALVAVFSQVLTTPSAMESVVEHVTHDVVSSEVGTSASVTPPTIDVIVTPSDMSPNR